MLQPPLGFCFVLDFLFYLCTVVDRTDASADAEHVRMASVQHEHLPYRKRPGSAPRWLPASCPPSPSTLPTWLAAFFPAPSTAPRELRACNHLCPPLRGPLRHPHPKGRCGPVPWEQWVRTPCGSFLKPSSILSTPREWVVAWVFYSLSLGEVAHGNSRIRTHWLAGSHPNKNFCKMPYPSCGHCGWNHVGQCPRDHSSPPPPRASCHR